MSAAVTIRRGTEADVAEVVLLERETATAPHWDVAEYQGMLRGGERGGLERALFVAAVGRVVYGFAVGMVVGSDRVHTAELESVVVRTGERRQGLGSALCRAVMEWAKEHGSGEMLLEVRAGSTGAIKLYGGLGFVATGRRAGYYRNPVEDAIHMHCTLSARPTHVVEEEQLTGWLDV